MHIRPLAANPASTAEIPVQHLDDGLVHVCTEVFARGQRCVAGRFDDRPVVRIRTPVFWAALRHRRTHQAGWTRYNAYFEARDPATAPLFKTTAEGYWAIRDAAGRGVLTEVDGHWEGLYTFRRRGLMMALWPYAGSVDGLVAAPVPVDAPDLSAFIATLGAPARP